MKANINSLVNCFASKFVLMLGMVFLSVSSAFAQEAFDKTSKLPLYFDGPEITVGQDNTLSLMLENQTGVASLEMLVKLPYGTFVDAQRSSSVFVGNEARIPSTMFQLFIDPVRGSDGSFISNCYKITLFNAYPNVAVKDAQNPMLAELTFHVWADLLGQKNQNIEVSEVILSDLNGKKLFEKEYNGKNFYYSLTPKAAKLNFNDEKLAICVGDTLSFGVAMDNKLEIRDFEFNVSLPKGLSIPKDENGLYMFEHAARLPKAHIFSVNDSNPQNLKVVVSNMTGAPIEGYGKSDLFSFKVVANGDFSQRDSVVIKNVIFTDSYANTYEMVDSIGILVENMTESYVKLQSLVAKLQENKDSANSHVARECPDVDSVWVKAQAAGLQSQIDSLNTKLAEIKKAYSFDKETENFELGVKSVQQSIDSFQVSADKYQARFVANVEAYKRLNETLAAAKQNLDSVKAEVGKSCKDVAAQFDAAFAEIQQDIDSVSASVKKSFEAGELTAESKVDTMTINQNVAKVMADAQAAQQKFIADEAKKVANAAAYERLNKEIAIVQSELDKAVAEIKEKYPNVADDFIADEALIQEAIDDLLSDVKSKYEAIELNADSKIEVSSIKFAISKLLLDAEKAYVASGIGNVIVSGSMKIVSVYTIDGKCVASPVKGWNIVKYDNGVVMKIYVK